MQFNSEQLRLDFILYLGMSSIKDFQKITPEALLFDEGDFQQQLLPVLRNAKKQADHHSWKEAKLQECKQALKKLLPFTDHESDEAHLVNGIHQAIVPSDLFWKVQKLLNKRMETHSHLCSKEKLRDELPLRGLLKCPQCGRNWTGSISSENGGKYPYYHCEKGCKSRANATIAHDQFFQFLNTLQPPPEVIDLQMAMMEVLFKSKEGDRDQQIKKLRVEIGHHKQNLLKFNLQRFISGELEADSYQRLKTHTLEQIDKLSIQVSDLEITDTAFQKYTKYGMSLLKDLAGYFKEAGLEAKRKLLGSIFLAKSTF